MKKAPVALVACATVALSLAGCANNPSLAASVNGTQVSVDEIGKAAAAIATSQQAAVQPAQYEAKVLENDILGLVAGKVAADQKITITDADRAGALDEATLAMRSNPDLKGLINHMADAQVVYKKVGYDKWIELCQGSDVTVNPRYGTWSPEMCRVIPDGSLSKQLAPTQP